jgi:hypothetical protein
MVTNIEEKHMAAAQRYAKAAVNDGLRQQILIDLASLGANGRYPNNVERDFHRYIRFDDIVADYIKIECVSTESTGTTFCYIPVLWPACVIQAVYDSGNWDKCMMCPPEVAADWWENAARDWAAEHPVVKNKLGHKTLPVRVA